MRALKNWIKTLLTEEYQVTIWSESMGKQVYYMKTVTKVDCNNVVGVLTTGEKFTMQTQEPFNFQVKKIH